MAASRPPAQATNPDADARFDHAAPTPVATLDFKWAPVPKVGTSNPGTCDSRPDTRPPPQRQVFAPSFAPPSRNFVPGGASYSDDKRSESQRSNQARDSGSKSLLTSQRRNESVESAEGETLDAIMTAPVPSSSRPQSQDSTTLPSSSLSHRGPPRSPGRGRVDLSHLRLGRIGGSPIPPAVHRSPPVPSDLVSQQTSSEEMVRTRSGGGGAQSNGPGPGPSSQPAPGRSSTTGSTATPGATTTAKSNSLKSESVDRARAGRGDRVLGGGMGEARVKQLVAATKLNEGEMRAICGAAGNMLHNLKDKDSAIIELWDLVADRDRQLSRVSDETERYKKDLAERTRRALDQVQAANKEVTDAYDQARNAFAAQSSEVLSSDGLEALRSDLEQLKKDFGESVLGSKGRDKLEKNEETKVHVLRQLQDQLQDRDRVIKLLRSDLETRTGEVSEARDTIAILGTERQVAYVRIDDLASEVKSTRLDCEREKETLRDAIDQARIEAGEREQVQLKHAEDAAERWSNLLIDAQERQKGLVDEVADVRAEMTKKLDERDQSWRVKLDTISHDDKEKIRALSVAHAEERLKLSHEVQIARNEADQATKHLTEMKHKLRTAENSIQGLVDSARQDQATHEALVRDKDAACDELKSRLVGYVSDVERYKVEIETLQDRFNAFESLTAESRRTEVTAFEEEKAQAISARQVAEVQLGAMTAERDTLASSVGDLEAQVAELVRQISETDVLRSSGLGSLSRIESTSEELERLREVEEAYKILQERSDESRRDDFDLAVQQMVVELEGRQAETITKLENEKKRLLNQLEDKTRRLNKAQNELAAVRGKPVLNPNSSSHGSTDSVGAGGENCEDKSMASGEGTSARELAEAVENGEVVENDISSVRGPGAATAQQHNPTALRLDEDHRTESHSSSLTPVDGSPSSDKLFAPPHAVTVPPVSRKRSIDTTGRLDSNESSVQAATTTAADASTSTSTSTLDSEVNKPVKRTKRTVSNENKGPADRLRAVVVVAPDRPKTKGQGRIAPPPPPEPNKFTATTKKKKKNNKL